MKTPGIEGTNPLEFPLWVPFWESPQNTYWAGASPRWHACHTGSDNVETRIQDCCHRISHVPPGDCEHLHKRRRGKRKWKVARSYRRGQKVTAGQTLDVGKTGQQSVTGFLVPFSFMWSKLERKPVYQKTCTLFPQNLSSKLLSENTHLCLLNKN